jgi:hypothetical protein
MLQVENYKSHMCRQAFYRQQRVSRNAFLLLRRFLRKNTSRTIWYTRYAAGIPSIRVTL